MKINGEKYVEESQLTAELEKLKRGTIDEIQLVRSVKENTYMRLVVNADSYDFCFVKGGDANSIVLDKGEFDNIASALLSYCNKDGKYKKMFHWQKSSESTSPENIGLSASDNPFTVTPLGNGKFNVLGDYYSLYSCVQQVFQDCQSNIKENDPSKGKIIGKCKYGINPFGITVTAIFYLNGNSTALEFSASLTDALDTMGVCHKKVSEFSDRFMALFSSFQPNIAGKPKDFPPVPPNYSQRAGESHA